MKRPFAVIGFSFLTTLLTAVFLGKNTAVLMGCIAVILLFVSLKSAMLRRTGIIPAICLTVAAAALSFTLYTGWKTEPAALARGETADVIGRISDLPYEKYGKIYYTLDAEEIVTEDGDRITDTKIIVSSEWKLKADLYDRVEMTVHFSSAERLYQTAKGILLSGSIDRNQPVHVTPVAQKPLYYYVLSVRNAMQECIGEKLPEREASLVSAVMTGDRSALYEEDLDAIRVSGVSHIIAVSGFHLSVLTWFLMLVLSALFMGKSRLAVKCCLVFVLLYMMVTGFSASVVRAGVMHLVVLFGIVIGRKPDPLNSLGLAALIIVLPNPYAAADLGYLLSLSSTLGILLFAGKWQTFCFERLKYHFHKNLVKLPLWKRVWMRVLKAIISVSCVTLAAMLCSSPVLILYFRNIPFYSILSNLLITPVLSVLIVAAFFMTLLSWSGIFSFLSLPFSIVSGVAVDIVFRVTGFIESLPFAVLRMDLDFMPLWIVSVIGVAFLLKRLGVRHFFALWLSGYLTLSFLIGSFALNILRRDHLRISVLDTGSGLSVILTEDHQASVLACGGDREDSMVLSDRMDRLCVDEVTYLLLLDSRTEVTGYAGTLLSEYRPDLIEVYDEENYREQVHSLIWQSGQVLCHSSQANEQNMVRSGELTVSSIRFETYGAVLAQWHDYRVLMLTSGTDCETLPEEWTDCDILIVNGKILHQERVSYRMKMISDGPGKNDGSADGNDNVYYTGDGYHLSMEVSPDGTELLRRDKNWLC